MAKDPKRAKTGRKSRNKGARAERQLAKLFEDWWGSEFARTPSSGGFQTKKFRDDWNAASDLVTPDPTFPFGVECKNQEAWSLWQFHTKKDPEVSVWWRQARDECPPDKHPLLCFTRNRVPFFFLMRRVTWGSRPVTMTLHIDGEELVCGLLSEIFETTTPDDWRSL